ncbi:Rho termination factor N-terminal domain-containing protein [Oscillatoria sp. FACHB-1406]|uniref:Rho termination factor N-terminal domain-containing protein n=1 Tax=Oscillatoria sp. FACHB-1406 TaxID=2692846 RepID=UPI001686882D|nr:Rho termination factor N-terminal domain-containing protein [Oscillatoria sp. FACHB-1406]MBD2579060.1 Rho termination factor [Oscillatoria sp. FACHB-1406]
MSAVEDIGKLMYLYLDDIEAGGKTEASTFSIKASARLLTEKGGTNWVPIIVKEIGRDKYQVIGNSFVYTVAEEAALERVWCIIVNPEGDAEEVVKVLSGEQMPKINLSTASRDEIASALEYLIKQPASPLKTVKLAVATNRIDEAPRQSWKNFTPITTLKCGITKGKKLDALKQVFYLEPEATSEPINKVVNEAELLSSLSVAELKTRAKQQGIKGISKMKKDALISALRSLEM